MSDARAPIIKITPRGYCYGVVDAIQLAKKVARDPATPKPVYILGQIVHNRHVVETLTREGIISLEGQDRMALLDEIETGTVIFTAHGVSPQVKAKAAAKGLNCVDATCPDVTRTHDLVNRLVAEGYEIVYIGKKGHPEPAGVMGEAPDHVHLVENLTDVEALNVSAERLAVTTQTTLSKWDTEALIEAIRAKYPRVEVHNEICSATQQRQEAAVRSAQEADLVLVVGDTRSNNSNRLVSVVKDMAGKPAYLVDNVDEVQPEWLEGRQRIAVTSGSSTPSELTREVIQFLEQRAVEPSPSDPAE